MITLTRIALFGLGIGLAYVGAIAIVGLAARPRAADMIVVLGNEVGADGRPSPRLAARLAAALDVWRAGLAPRLLVSGGVGRSGRDEATAMAAWLVGHGVPSECIIRDSLGRTTWATAEDVAGLVKPGTRVVVASQWFHLPRAMLALRRQGLDPVGGAWPRFAEWRDVYSLAREAVALPAYAVRPVVAAPSTPPPQD
ncbi:YdcF family protein [Glacieibacterium megasporae]|uniref:YdcF family protein n=1 Tax=Glacieibacterium megasporae TaxID=2835787 RepID=UPI001C1E8880|nr:YdcF family protein [Polymorphobacter megasporae]UAJ11627.1 YdcF family protein [Polymorphobacter megasporae]